MKKRKSPQVTAKAAESFGGAKGLHLGGPECPSGNTGKAGPGSACERRGQEDCCRFEARVGHSKELQSKTE